MPHRKEQLPCDVLLHVRGKVRGILIFFCFFLLFFFLSLIMKRIKVHAASIYHLYTTVHCGWYRYHLQLSYRVNLSPAPEALVLQQVFVSAFGNTNITAVMRQVASKTQYR